LKKIMKRLILAAAVVSVLAASVRCHSNIAVKKFADVPEHEWFAESVAYVNAKGLMNGVSATKFDPKASITRGMIVTIIYRLAGSPQVNTTQPFEDVKLASYYSAPIAWAYENGVVNGYSKDVFAPDKEITREQLSVILHRYAQKQGVVVRNGLEKESLSAFKDNDKISGYAEEALAWASMNGLLQGVTATTLAPQGKATRAQAATIIMRFDKLLAQFAESSVSPNEPDNEHQGNNKTDHDAKDDHDANAGEWDDVSGGAGKDSTAFEKPTIAMDNVFAKAGERIEVKVSIHKNPGILGAILNVAFDEKLVLVDAAEGSAFSELTMTKPGRYITNCNFLWDGLDKTAKKDGEIMTLVFAVSDEAKPGDKMRISCSYLPGDIVGENFEMVDLSVIGGMITIR